MWAWVLKFVLPGLEDEALKAVADFVNNLIRERELIKQGMSAQAAKETATAEKTQAAMAQAAADAPKSKDAALGRLEGGTA